MPPLRQMSELEEQLNSQEEEVRLDLDLNQLYHLRLPHLELCITHKTPESDVVFTNNLRSKLGPTTGFVCLNDTDLCDEVKLRINRVIGNLFSSVEIIDCEFQLSLSPDLFAPYNAGERVLWAAGNERKLPADACVNFFSSKLSGINHSAADQEVSLGLTPALLQGLFFDFACSSATLDIDGHPAQSHRAAAEQNMRSLSVYMRGIFKIKLGDATLTITADPWDTLEHGQFTLVSAFKIKKKSALSAKERVFHGDSYEPQGVIIHVWDATGFPKSGPTFTDGRSAHYVISRDGLIWNYVAEKYLAYHARYVTTTVTLAWRTYNKNCTVNWDLDNPFLPNGVDSKEANPNYDTIGIEHEGEEATKWELRKYCASGCLLQDMYTRWENLKTDNTRIIRHNQVNTGKACPGKADMSYLIGIASGYRVRKRLPSDPPQYE